MNTRLELVKYNTLVFDCDGVVLNSNKIKSNAFYEATKHFGPTLAQKLVDYHVSNGGISRYVKAKYFIKDILKQPFDESMYQDILKRYAEAVKDGLMQCEVAQGLKELKARTLNSNWLIVSGGDQNELRDVFAARGLKHYFDGGIYGSPDSKDTILTREINKGNITKPSLFIGDSKYDYKASKAACLDFVFINQWTEVENHIAWCRENNLRSRFGLLELASDEYS